MTAGYRRLTWTGYGVVALIGVYIAALGPGLPAIAARTHTSLAIAGTLLTALFAGGIITSIAAGQAMDRYGRQRLLIAGSIAHGAGCLALALAGSWPAALAAATLMGAGDSTVIIGYHVLLVELNPGRPGAALNRLNVSFGLGALAGPALAGLSLLVAGDIRYVLVSIALLQVLAALTVAGARFPVGHRAETPAEPFGMRQLLARRLFWLLAAALFIYVALEVGLGNWTYTYLRRGGVGVGTASLLSSCFWLALALSRAVGPFLLRQLDEAALLSATAAGTVLVALPLTLFAPQRVVGAVCIVLLGFGFGPVWPLAFAIGARAYAQKAGAASGLFTTAGSLGGLVGPWLQGVLLVQQGARWGMAVALAGSLVLAMLALAIRREPSAGAAPALEALRT